MMDEANCLNVDSKLSEVLFKGLSPSTTPFGKRKFIRIVESKIPLTTAFRPLLTKCLALSRIEVKKPPRRY
jgi:hypothetical protein